VTVVGRIVLGMLTGLQAHFETGDHRDQKPLELEQGVTLAWTQSSESHHWMFDLLAGLVELGINETIELKHLNK